MTVTEVRSDLATDAAIEIEVETIDPNAPREVTFDADRLPRLIEELARLNKIAKKLGADPIAYEVTGTGTRKAHHPPTGFNCRGIEYEVDTVTVTLTGASPRLPGGWKYLGSIEFLNGGPGAEDGRLVHGDDPRVGTYRDGDDGCDHCGYARNRNKVVVLVNDEDELTKVGSTCLKDFLGYHGDPEKVTWFAEDIGNTISELSEEGGRFHAPDDVPTDVFIALSTATVRTFGWVAKSSYDGIPTARRVSDLFFPPRETKHNKDYLDELATVKITDSDETKAAAIKAWAAELDLTNNYLGNVRVVLGGNYVSLKHFGIAASAVGTYDREMGFAAERVAKEAGIVSEWVGTVGKRETFTLEVTRIHVYETAYGTSRIVVFKDEAGNTVKTFTSGNWAYRAEVGDKLVAKGTVKEHGEYKGTKETVLTRVAVVTWIDEEEDETT